MNGIPDLATTRKSGLLTIIGAGLIALGSFLPWVTATSGFGSLNKSGMEGGDGILTLTGAVLLGLIGFSVYTGSAKKPNIAGLWIVLAAASVAVIAMIDYQDLNERIDELQREVGTFVSANIGAGLWTVGVGAIAALADGVMLMRMPEVENA